jgi:hypothetical protein
MKLRSDNLSHPQGCSPVLRSLGYDSGSCVAGFCALMRPDLFEHFMLISDPLHGRPIARYPQRAEDEPSIAITPVAREGPGGCGDHGKITEHCAVQFDTRGERGYVYGHEEPERFLRRSVPVRLSSH